jgi:uncharacterized protein YbjT (DUF2867 family)
MNITITGSLGNISQRLTASLVAKGHKVTVISHNPDRAGAIEELQAIPAIGLVEDDAFLLKAFDKADAVYTMIPPDFSSPDPRDYIRRVGEGYARAIAEKGIRYVVNLSSIGAFSPDGPGPTGANHHVENKLNELKDTHVLHLRPGMFYTNFFGSMPLIKHKSIIGNNFGATVNILLSHPQDIADAAADAFDRLHFTGKEALYVVSDEKNGGEIAAILSQAINRPDLAWVEFSDEQLLQAMAQAGVPLPAATVYVVEIGIALRNGTLFEDYRRKENKVSGKIRFTEFAAEFAAVYNNS